MKYDVGDRVLFMPEVAEGSYYNAAATITELLVIKDMRGIPLRRIEFDDGHSLSVSVAELMLASDND